MDMSVRRRRLVLMTAVAGAVTASALRLGGGPGPDWPALPPSPVRIQAWLMVPVTPAPPPTPIRKTLPSKPVK